MVKGHFYLGNLSFSQLTLVLLYRMTTGKCKKVAAKSDEKFTSLD
jgi:hypothetical protein